ncbi:MULTISPECIES: DUF6999 family protein [Cyanophyceae]|uniref:Uncharacterized protein n=1 Tax=Leptolyngbya subtilissima DQ-A4 TaxID=2933933 RepID=A0ABV0K8H3_9CYAN|nr:hypothetical protein [Nodosilinea sp. FACHB-141]MBD2110243.1 hypothetical protein [Nodosilinea sp. FACHB-141]
MTYTPVPHNRQDPNYWDAIYADWAIPLDPTAKAYMVKDLQSWSRSYLLLPIKLFANLVMALIMTLKRLLPFQFRNYWLMHQLAVWFLNTFTTPEACYLIVRHFAIGSNIVNFLIDNGPDPTLPHATLYPRRVEDLAANAFLEHDINLYNFVLDYHRAQEQHPNWLESVRQRGLSYGGIRPVSVEIDITRRGWLQVLDMESSLELFKICYSLWVTSDEFERAVLSLQFDESFALYFSRVTGDYAWNHTVKNRHPLAPNSPFGSARNLLLHGLASESLQRYLELATADSCPEAKAVAINRVAP